MRVVCLACCSLLLLSCNIEVKVDKPHTVALQVPASSTPTQACSQTPFGSAPFDIAALAKDAEVDFNAGCLKSATWTLVTEVTSLGGGTGPGGACAHEQGVVTIDTFRIDFTCGDGTSTSLATPCPVKSINLPDGSIFDTLNACLDAFEVEQAEPLRRAFNTCKPTAMVGAFHGSCTADTCFTADFKVAFRLASAVAVINGSCP